MIILWKIRIITEMVGIATHVMRTPRASPLSFGGLSSCAVTPSGAGRRGPLRSIVAAIVGDDGL